MKSTIKEKMEKAYRTGILIPAFNAAYHEMVKPICETLIKLQTYGICEISRPDIEKFGIESFTHAAEYYWKYSDSEYMSLHQDHVPVIDEDGFKVDYKKLIQEALKAGYNSVGDAHASGSSRVRVKIVSPICSGRVAVLLLLGDRGGDMPHIQGRASCRAPWRIVR